MKLDTNTMRLRAAPERGMLEMTLPSYLTSFDLVFSTIPGVRFRSNRWLIPSELEAIAMEKAAAMGLRAMRIHEPETSYGEINPELYPYQKAAVRSTLQHKAHMLLMEMGLGKSAVAIEVVRLLCENVK